MICSIFDNDIGSFHQIIICNVILLIIILIVQHHFEIWGDDVFWHELLINMKKFNHYY